MSREKAIQNVFSGGGHIVILGAGASIAATIRNPEKSGKKLPSMDNLVEVVGLSDIVNQLPKELQNGNFESLYSELHTKKYSTQLAEIEKGSINISVQCDYQMNPLYMIT